MPITEALLALLLEYDRQCSPDSDLDSRCLLESHGPTPDDARRVEIGIGIGTDERAFFCLREQYGEWEECPLPIDRTDWRLVK